MAALEKLPIELLQKVFLLSMNLDLPRSSPIIAGKLSGEHTYIQFLTLVFGPTWEWDYSMRTNDVILMSDDPPGDPKLQVYCPRLTK